MKPGTVIHRGLESALNRYLGLDPATGARLAALDGRMIALDLRGLDLTLMFASPLSTIQS